MSDASGEIAALTEGRPATAQILAAVIDVWPEHARYIAKGLGLRDSPMMETTETLAAAALTLAGDRLPQIAAHYRWTCDRLREEELNFHRTGAYRLKTFEEADREVYSNAAYMEKYIDGLLLTQVLWYNHAASADFYLRRAPGLLTGRRMLEIGPGHGLMMYLALRDFGLESATAWDISAVSVEQTRAALAELGFANATFAVQDIMAVPESAGPFDFIVLSEVLEHLEDPMAAMHTMRRLTVPGGLVFVNVPINSPSPDHLYLIEDLDGARALLQATGFEIAEEAFFATQGREIGKAIRQKISVSACLFGRAV